MCLLIYCQVGPKPKPKPLITVEDGIVVPLVPIPGDLNVLSPAFQIIHEQSEARCVNLRKTGECLFRFSLARRNR